MPDNIAAVAPITAAASNRQTADPTCTQVGDRFSREGNLKTTQAVLHIVCLCLAAHVLCVAA